MSLFYNDLDRPWDVLYIPSLAASFSLDHLMPTIDAALLDEIEADLRQLETLYVVDSHPYEEDAGSLAETVVPAAYMLDLVDGGDDEGLVIIGNDPDGSLLGKCLDMGASFLFAANETRCDAQASMASDVVAVDEGAVAGRMFRYAGVVGDDVLWELAISYLADDMRSMGLSPWLTRIAEATCQFPALDEKGSVSASELFDAFCFGQCPRNRLAMVHEAQRMLADERKMGWMHHMKALRLDKVLLEDFYGRKPGADIIGVRNFSIEVVALWEAAAQECFSAGKLSEDVENGIGEYDAKARETLDWMGVKENAWLVFVLSVGYVLGLDYLLEAVLGADVPMEVAVAGTAAADARNASPRLP